MSRLYHGNFSVTGHQDSTSWMYFRGALSYGNLGCASPPRSDIHSSSSAHSKSRSSPSCYSIWLLPSAVTVTSSWWRTRWRNLYVGQERWVTSLLILSLYISRLLSAIAELLGQYETACTGTRRGLNISYPHQPRRRIIKSSLRHL